jgi:hypothetical protein
LSFSFLFFSFQSAKSRTESRRASAKSKDEEPLKLPPIHGEQTGGSADENNDEKDEEMEEEPKVEELDDYGKLVKAIEGKVYIVL